ncbi:motilin receptor [Phlebotomus argentipes]|uniref:motilin receptor n=1 Tax=Phlebotomus argentipes TaxID=94469 RepID=UPI002892C3AF|nr:motilin receptor [Phlebotomus argentipes]XP_059620906.1 motilin receptor [Phlebotomus argentipes]
MEDDTLKSLRYCFQRILVPCVVIIGVLGNFVTVIVLTRRRMRCSTNVYLTALAVADMVFLLFNFILSLQHYPNINRAKYELYWRTYGLSHWFCDASSYSSIYLTVSFTIERYIAVCHPIRGQILCTESRAKRVIAVVVVLCFLLTGTTSFEYQLDTTERHVSGVSRELCLPPEANATSPATQEDVEASTVAWLSTLEVTSDVDAEMDGDYELNGNKTEEITNSTSKDDICVVEIYFKAIPSELGKNSTYRTIFYIMTSVLFTFLPLILLATFNCFLIAAVHRSHKNRHQMTNARQGDTSTSQENKVTVTLIAVVLLFLICQTPTAIFLIYTSWAPETSDPRSLNLNRAMGNILNFLVTMNAACNFLLYCAFSAKYRATVAHLLSRRPKRQGTVSSRFSRYATRGTVEQSIRRKSSYLGASGQPNARISQAPRPSLTPSDADQFDMTRQGKQVMRNCSSRSTASRRRHVLLPESNSNNRRPSLTRSQSLILPVVPRHSPDCKSNPNNF